MPSLCQKAALDLQNSCSKLLTAVLGKEKNSCFEKTAVSKKKNSCFEKKKNSCFEKTAVLKNVKCLFSCFGKKKNCSKHYSTAADVLVAAAMSRST